MHRYFFILSFSIYFMSFLKKIFGEKKKPKKKEVKDYDYYLKKGIIEEEEGEIYDFSKPGDKERLLKDQRDFEKARREQIRKNRESIGKTRLKGKVIYNFSGNKSEKFTLKFEITEKGIIQTEAVGLKNLEGLSNLSEQQKSKIMKEIEKFDSKKSNGKNEIKITFEGKLK